MLKYIFYMEIRIKIFFVQKPDFAQYSDPVSLCPGRSVRITVPLSLCV